MSEPYSSMILTVIAFVVTAQTILVGFIASKVSEILKLLEKEVK